MLHGRPNVYTKSVPTIVNLLMMLNTIKRSKKVPETKVNALGLQPKPFYSFGKLARRTREKNKRNSHKQFNAPFLLPNAVGRNRSPLPRPFR